MNIRALACILFTLASLLPQVWTDYTIGIEQIQPLSPEPGDTVVFKITMANEVRWSRVLKAKVISPDGRIWNIKDSNYRAGEGIIHSEYIAWRVPEDALVGNYTLEVVTPESVFQAATFRVFRYPKLSYSDNVLTNLGTAPARDVELWASSYYRYLGELLPRESVYIAPDWPEQADQLLVTYRYDKSYNESYPITAALQPRISTSLANNTFHVNVTSEQALKNLRLKVLPELPVRIKSVNDTMEQRYKPVSFLLLGQDTLYLGDTQEARAHFEIMPLGEYVSIPLLVQWHGGEELLTYSGKTNVSPPESPRLNVSALGIPEKNESRPPLLIIVSLIIIACIGGWLLWKRRQEKEQ
jgi:hypothetical protein